MSDVGATFPIYEHPQGWNRRKSNRLWMPGSIESLENVILERRLRVHVNPMLRSAVAGATFVKSPAGLKRFTKQAATTRIDAVIALTQAVGAWETPEPGETLGESIYDRGDKPERDEMRLRRGDI